MPRSKAHLRGQELINERNREKKMDLDAIAAIRRFILDPKDIFLSEEEELIFKRLKTAWFNECEGFPIKTVIAKQVSIYSISERQAWIDLKNAREVIFNPKLVNKAASAAIAGEMAKKIYRLALVSKDFKGSAAALAQFIKSQGLDRDDPEMPDFSKLIILKDEISLPPEQMKMLEFFVKSAGNPVINISEIMQNFATDIKIQDEEE